MKAQINIEFPRSLAEAVADATTTPARALLEAAVLGLYREGRLSSGAAAEVLDMERYEFVRYAGRRGIPFLDPKDEELEEELEILRSTTQETPSSP